MHACEQSCVTSPEDGERLSTAYIYIDALTRIFFWYKIGSQSITLSLYKLKDTLMTPVFDRMVASGALIEYPLSRWIAFITITLFQIKMDRHIGSCSSQTAKWTIALHHALSVYIYFGAFLFPYHLAHLIVVLSSGVFQKIYGMCPITVVTNGLCGFPPNMRMPTTIDLFFDKRASRIVSYALIGYAVLRALLIKKH